MTRGISPRRVAIRKALLESLSVLDLPKGTKAIPLTRGMHCLVDVADYDFLMGWNWYAMVGDRSKFYASRTSRATDPGGRGASNIRMHNVLMNPPKGMEVDHINGNSLDNRRSNLRVCKHSHNMRNLPKPRDGRTSSPYKGVSWHKDHECWQAMIKKDYKQKWLGNFEDAKDAALAYNRAAIEHFGEFARLNEL